MKITLSVDTGDGPQVVTTSFFNVVTWERKYKRPASQLAAGIAAEDLAFLAYEASKSAGITVPLIFDDYLKKIVALDVVSSEDQNPTEPGATAAA